MRLRRKLHHPGPLKPVPKAPRGLALRLPADSWRNRSQASRLPAWAKAAGNREEILKAIAKTRASRL